MNLKDQISKIAASIKEFWSKLAPKQRLLIKIVAVALVAAAALITLLMYIQKSQYKVLYSGLDSEETTQVYAALQTMEPPVSPQLNASGEIMVPAERYDELLLALAELNYPKSTLSYDTLLNTSFTATETDKRNAAQVQLAKNITQTLNSISGVQNTNVILNIPNDTRHVWDQAVIQESSASVTMTMKAGASLSPERVTAIKNLVAAGVPNMKPENVTVVNGSTGVEMQGVPAEGASLYSTQRLEFEQQCALTIENNVRRILEPSYGQGNVAVVARVEVDYDKMITETFTQNPEGSTNPDPSRGVLSERERDYGITGQEPVSGIVGEEDNTDVPTYGLEEDGNGGMTDYHSYEKYISDYVKRQIEKQEPIITSATVAVTVNDTNLTDQRRAELMDLVAKAANVDTNAVTVSQMYPQNVGTIAPGLEGTEGEDRGISMWVWYVVGICLVIGVILLILLLLMRKRHKAKTVAQEEESAQLINSLQAEIEERKKQIAEAAQAETNPSDGAIVDEIRGFAKDNPEITANLIRSWLKEDA